MPVFEIQLIQGFVKQFVTDFFFHLIGHCTFFGWRKVFTVFNELQVGYMPVFFVFLKQS
ncbi:hypothetical protein [Paenibacillus elgii]|uniref:hypothetical protein n=1 Tax=Paenibacillus elgii TaxID=189691 RepID=UPI001EF98338|nr:hypothetical protein [Paenibacillus elgii]